MRLKHQLRVLAGRFFYKKTVLFSRKPSREKQIIRNLNTCFPCFSSFRKVNPNHFYIIFPLAEKESIYLNDHYSYLNHVKAIVPSNAAINICKDKKIFTEFLLKNGLETYAIKTPDKLCYPYVIKKRIDADGENTVIVDDKETESRYKNELVSDEFFTQEYIEGSDEYAMHIIMHKKEVIYYKTMKYTFEQNKFVKGSRYKQYSQTIVDHSHFIDQFQNILNTINYEGICCIDYKVINEYIKIFEINARMGASLSEYIDEALYAYANALNLSC